MNLFCVGRGKVGSILVDRLLQSKKPLWHTYLVDKNSNCTGLAPYRETRFLLDNIENQTFVEQKNQNVVILAVRPNQVASVATLFNQVDISYEVMSVVAGISTPKLQSYFKNATHISRCMPVVTNPLLFGQIFQQTSVYGSALLHCWTNQPILNFENDDALDQFMRRSSCGLGLIAELLLRLQHDEDTQYETASLLRCMANTVDQHQSLRQIERRVKTPGGFTEALSKTIFFN